MDAKSVQSGVRTAGLRRRLTFSFAFVSVAMSTSPSLASSRNTPPPALLSTSFAELSSFSVIGACSFARQVKRVVSYAVVWWCGERERSAEACGEVRSIPPANIASVY